MVSLREGVMTFRDAILRHRGEASNVTEPGGQQSFGALRLVPHVLFEWRAV